MMKTNENGGNVMEKMYEGKKVLTADEFSFSKLQIGDLVDGEIVDDLMELLPPACMTSRCSQVGEPHSIKIDDKTGQARETFATFTVIGGTYPNRIWKYCGNCFRGEIEERGSEIPLC